MNMLSRATNLTISICNKIPLKNSILVEDWCSMVMPHHQWLRLILIIFLINSPSKIWIQIFSCNPNRTTVFWTLARPSRQLSQLVISMKIQWECLSPQSLMLNWINKSNHNNKVTRISEIKIFHKLKKNKFQINMNSKYQ